MFSKMILPPSYYQAERQPDDNFVSRLRSFDKYLIVYWNKLRMRWVIDRYACETDHAHGPQCPRVHVLLVEGEDGDFHPLSDRVFERLGKADMWKSTPDKINEELDAQKAAYDRSREDDLRHSVREAIHDEHMREDSTFPNVHAKG